MSIFSLILLISKGDCIHASGTILPDGHDLDVEERESSTEQSHGSLGSAQLRRRSTSRVQRGGGGTGG
jgi:hypothetical protein